jgi:hypothetical protein
LEEDQPEHQEKQLPQQLSLAQRFSSLPSYSFRGSQPQESQAHLPLSNATQNLFPQPSQTTVPRPFEVDQRMQAMDFDLMDDAYFDLDAMDWSLLLPYNEVVELGAAKSTSISASDQVDSAGSPYTTLSRTWLESPWHWIPTHGEHSYAEQGNAAVPLNDMDITTLHFPSWKRVIKDRISLSTRDTILAVFLSTCQPAIVNTVASSFPSADLLDCFMNAFFVSLHFTSNMWLHMNSFNPAKAEPELLMAIIAKGATLMSRSTLRRFGYALQEAVRTAIVNRVF